MYFLSFKNNNLIPVSWSRGLRLTVSTVALVRTPMMKKCSASVSDLCQPIIARDLGSYWFLMVTSAYKDHYTTPKLVGKDDISFLTEEKWTWGQ